MSAPVRVVVAGASLAGLRTVEALRRLGYAGSITVLGAEPHLPYDRPPLSKEVIAGKWDVDRTALRKPESYADLGAEWRLATPASGLDVAGRAVLCGDERLPYDALVIATGCTPRRLPGPPLDGVHVLRTIEDAHAIRRAFDAGARVAVVGAGFIGGEVAATARGRGLSVTVIEALSAPLERQLGAAMGARVVALHRDHGVDLRVGVGVAALEGHRRVERVRLADGAEVEADLVVVGIGVTPNTSWLAGSHVAVSDGVLCDAHCRTNAPGVFAVGDVARWHHVAYGEHLRIEHWTNATEMADAAAAALLAGDADAPPYQPVPYFWSDQFGVKMQLAGRVLPGDEVSIVDGSLEERRFVALYHRAGKLAAVLGWNRPRVVMQYRRELREAGVG